MACDTAEQLVGEIQEASHFGDGKLENGLLRIKFKTLCVSFEQVLGTIIGFGFRRKRLISSALSALSLIILLRSFPKKLKRCQYNILSP